MTDQTGLLNLRRDLDMQCKKENYIGTTTKSKFPYSLFACLAPVAIDGITWAPMNMGTSRVLLHITSVSG